MERKEFAFEPTDINVDEGVIKGIAAVFGNVDSGNDRIMKGAFTRSINARAGRIKVGWQHDLDHPLGTTTLIKEIDRDELPAAVLELAPDATGGLYVEAKVSMTTTNRERLQLIKDGAVDGLSIGYIPTKEDWKTEYPVRRLHEIKLFEWSPVTIGMNEAAMPTYAKRLEDARREAEGTTEPVETKIDPLDELLLELKAGRRNSRPDEAKLKAAHDHIHEVLNMPHHDMNSQSDAEDATDNDGDEAAENAKSMALLHQRLTLARSGAPLMEVA